MRKISVIRMLAPGLAAVEYNEVVTIWNRRKSRIIVRPEISRCAVCNEVLMSIDSVFGPLVGDDGSMRVCAHHIESRESPGALAVD